MNYLIFILSQGRDATTASLETEIKLKDKLTDIENSMDSDYSDWKRGNQGLPRLQYHFIVLSPL